MYLSIVQLVFRNAYLSEIKDNGPEIQENQ